MSAQRTTAHMAAELLGAGGTTVIDVGARWGASDAWWRLAPLARVLGFDPDPNECARLNAASVGRGETYIPLALGAKAEVAELHVTSEPACSSIYPPIEELGHRYPELSCLRVVEKQSVHLARLDDWARGARADDVSFMKLDTQGAEFDILRGAENVLRGCVGLEIEAEFSPLYAGQPLFSDIDPWLRERGFVLWRLESPVHYSEHLSCLASGEDSIHFAGRRQPLDTGSGRLFWANAIYFRDYAAMPIEEGVWKRMVVLASLLDAKGDLAAAASCIQRVLHEDGSLPDEHRDALETRCGELTERLIEGRHQPTRLEKLSSELKQAEARLIEELSRKQEADRQRTSYSDVGPLALKMARTLTSVSRSHPRISAAIKSILPRSKSA